MGFISLAALLAVACCHLAAGWRINPHDEDIGIRAGAPVVYKGAVLEYEPYNLWTEAGGDFITRENARIIAQYAMEAKELGVDILVAPEYSIQSLEMQVMNNSLMFSLMQYVPDPVLKVIPCNDPTDPLNVEAVRILSCAALENEIYIVADLAEVAPCSPLVPNPFNNALDNTKDCPPSGQQYHNTQVVFDRDGAVIARYRKKNLFLEWQFTPGTDPNEMAIFTTDFGVTFTLQVCFDIAYFNPGVSNIVNYGIKDVIMSTAWVDMLPFHIAPSVQNGWSRGLGVNLLVSGYHLPESSKLGSGIYRGASDLVNVYTFDPDSGNRLLVSDVSTTATVDVKLYDVVRHQANAPGRVPRAQQTFAKIPEERGFAREHTIYYDDLTNFTQVHLVKGDSQEIQQAEACHADGLCCKLSYYPTSNLNYSLLAFSGPVIKGWGAYSIYAQTCSVLWCSTEDVKTCGRVDNGLPGSDTFGNFTLSGNFASSPYIYPTVFNRDLDLVDNSLYTFTSEGTESTISTSGPVTDLMTAGFYTRWYERDP